MIERIGRSAVHLLTAVLIGAGVAACDDGNTFTGPDDGDTEQQFATVEGRVESTHQTASTSRTPVTTQSTSPAAAPAADASTVAVAAVQGDGTLEVLAEAEVQADGSFTVEEVPAGRSDLVVVARSEAGDEVGRVLVHGETTTNAVTTTAPINGETTVEGHVFATLTEAGVSEEIRNTAQLALLLRLDESTASEVAASARAIQDAADGYRAAAETMAGAFAEIGADVDGQAKAQAMLEAAQEHAQSRNDGADENAAAEAFLQAGLEALAQAGADAEEASLATTAAATGLDRAMAEANESARLDMARNAVELNFMAREALLAEVPDGEEKQKGAEALAQAEVDAEAAASVSELARALQDAEDSFGDQLLTLVMDALSNVPDDVRARIRTRLETAFAEANFGAEVQASASPEEIGQAVADYREQVQSAVQSFVDSLPGDGSVSAQVSVELLVAVQGGANLDGGGG